MTLDAQIRQLYDERHVLLRKKRLEGLSDADSFLLGILEDELDHLERLENAPTEKYWAERMALFRRSALRVFRTHRIGHSVGGKKPEAGM